MNLLVAAVGADLLDDCGCFIVTIHSPDKVPVRVGQRVREGLGARVGFLLVKWCC